MRITNPVSYLIFGPLTSGVIDVIKSDSQNPMKDHVYVRMTDGTKKDFMLQSWETSSMRRGSHIMIRQRRLGPLSANQYRFSVASYDNGN